ncbi:MAG: hypothetical protein R3358_07205 [Woeseiaceae bacterium]|nr:hypothetical protein [Woeseiaceae bacterium]
MIRLLGAITGSALALAALLVFVGVPQFKAKPEQAERAIVTLPVRTEPARAQTAPATIPETSAADDTPSLPVAAPPTDPAGERLAQAPQDLGKAIPIDDPVFRDDPVSSDDVEADALQPDSLQWYAFWSPFRSEIAANGFVEQLQRVTGLDYRVIKIKPGVYEVAFAYADDADIPLNLSQISAATGLDMPES